MPAIVPDAVPRVVDGMALRRLYVAAGFSSVQHRAVPVRSDGGAARLRSRSRREGGSANSRRLRLSFAPTRVEHLHRVDPGPILPPDSRPPAPPSCAKAVPRPGARTAALVLANELEARLRSHRRPSERRAGNRERQLPELPLIWLMAFNTALSSRGEAGRPVMSAECEGGSRRASPPTKSKCSPNGASGISSPRTGLPHPPRCPSALQRDLVASSGSRQISSQAVTFP